MALALTLTLTLTLMGEVMESAEAWIHGNFNRSAVHILETRFAGEVTIVQSMTNGALTQGLEAANSMPWQAFSGVTLAIAMLLMFLAVHLFISPRRPLHRHFAT